MSWRRRRLPPARGVEYSWCHINVPYHECGFGMSPSWWEVEEFKIGWVNVKISGPADLQVQQKGVFGWQNSLSSSHGSLELALQLATGLVVHSLMSDNCDVLSRTQLLTPYPT
jgi:hypothetical protein